ncbi:4,5-dihydroxyphthalate decarboxylase [Sphingomonas vulcanisoli]|uniref:4,5-dihydroxyphthalate decarboxylase n=1 Tax=Sphingomonas vulcanisoli TaxID=1658060 RepID=A0ABX0TXP9_9SPHN|nr:ABC transporter substrate-binding protein [Sphingomonas vulcanisoli]NIJ09237.1 4,5-dihydroxyphthalate decarboxylase [Sphingomonas vulcanisoli]
MSDYDHVRDLASGVVRPEGIDLTVLTLQVEEIFFRTLKYREFDASEISMAKYSSLVSQGGCDLIAIPVFPSRMHRHSSIYVRSDTPLRTPQDLVGRRVGLPEWAQTAAVYSRGFLAHQYGLDLASIDWVQASVNQPGRGEKVALALPKGITIERRPDTSLNAMLLSGEVDAVLSAHPPHSVEQGDPRVKRLIGDFLSVEQDYFRETRIFPIMHTVVFRREVYERNPWIAGELYKCLEEAKDRSVARALDFNASRFPIPWGAEHARRAMETMPDDYFPYGIAPNRTTLEAFLTYAHEQGVLHRPLEPEELFAPNTLETFKI